MEVLIELYSVLSIIDPVKVVEYDLASSVEFYSDVPLIGVEGAQGSFILFFNS